MPVSSLASHLLRREQSQKQPIWVKRRVINLATFKYFFNPRESKEAHWAREPVSPSCLRRGSLAGTQIRTQCGEEKEAWRRGRTLTEALHQWAIRNLWWTLFVANHSDDLVFIGGTERIKAWGWLVIRVGWAELARNFFLLNWQPPAIKHQSFALKI